MRKSWANAIFVMVRHAIMMLPCGKGFLSLPDLNSCCRSTSQEATEMMMLYNFDCAYRYQRLARDRQTRVVVESSCGSHTKHPLPPRQSIHSMVPPFSSISRLVSRHLRAQLRVQLRFKYILACENFGVLSTWCTLAQILTDPL